MFDKKICLNTVGRTDKNGFVYPLTPEAVCKLIDEYITDKAVKVSYKNVVDVVTYSNSDFIEEEAKKKESNNLSFTIILEGKEKPTSTDRYHFLLVMHCYGKTYVFDSIGRGKLSMDRRIQQNKGKTLYPYKDWDDGLIKFANNLGAYITDTELQKDSESCGDYVVEFAKILYDKYKEHEKNSKLFYSYLQMYFNTETKSEIVLQETTDDEGKKLLYYLFHRS